MNNPNSSEENRGQWGSKLGFIMAAAGSAVGLGNIWRFPYMTGENGGAAFVVVYLACVVFIGVPLLWWSWPSAGPVVRNPVGAFREHRGRFAVHTHRRGLCLAACFFVLTYYGVIAGWTISYAMRRSWRSALVFDEYTANPRPCCPSSRCSSGHHLIVQAGVEKGIEKWSKILMPLLFVMMVVIIRSVTLEGARKASNIISIRTSVRSTARSC